MDAKTKKILDGFNEKLQDATQRTRTGDLGAAKETLKLMAARNRAMSARGYEHNGKDGDAGAWVQCRKVFTFEVEFNGEPAAGLNPYTETVTVMVKNDPGGEEGEFKEFIKDGLREWFDGATVYDEDEMDAYVAQQERLVEGD